MEEGQKYSDVKSIMYDDEKEAVKAFKDVSAIVKQIIKQI